MHSVLLKLCPILVWVFCAFHVWLMFKLFPKYKATKNPLYLLTALVTAGLCYDALVLSLGTVLPEGGLLKALSQFRYISHGLLIPLLLPIGAYALGFNKVGKTIVWVITAALIIVGGASGFVTVTTPETVGLIRYANNKAATPGWATTVSNTVLAFGMIIPLILAGIIVWIKQKTPRLFLAGFFMFLFSALGPATGNMDLLFFISMAGEVLMVLFFMLYANFNEKKR